MNQEKVLETQKEDLIKKIEKNFKNIELWDWIGPNEAFAMDERLEEDSPEYKVFKAKDERHDWKKIAFYPTKKSDWPKYFSMKEGADQKNNINYGHWRAFSDIAWKKFSLAPYMISIITSKEISIVPDILFDMEEITFNINKDGGDDEDDKSYLDYFENQYKELINSLSTKQKEIIVTFLNFTIEVAKYRLTLLENEEYIKNTESIVHKKEIDEYWLNWWILSQKTDIIGYIKKKALDVEYIKKLINQKE